MNVGWRRVPQGRGMWAAAGLWLGALAALGCSSEGDQAVASDASTLDAGVGDVGGLVDGLATDVLAADGAQVGDGAGQDTAAADAGIDTTPCAGWLGCPCQGNQECDSGLCVKLDTGAVCGLDCQGGCDDANPCSIDLCVPATSVDAEPACTHSQGAEGGACDDGNPCTEGASCAAGLCAGGKAKACGDDNPCTTDYCDAAGTCQHDPVAAKPCDDGDVCTVGDSCIAGKCAGGQAQVCDDGNPCTVDTCDAASGCKAGNDDGKACDDGDACTGSKDSADACKGGVCGAGATADCDDGDPCTVDGCSSLTGCSHTQQVGAPCSDGDVCTVGDACGQQGCAGGAQQPCDDGNPCTDNTCDKLQGCAAVANKAACSDGDACTVGDACQGGVCLPGALTACDDLNPCTVDACDPGDATQAGGCVNKALDGGACVPQDDSCAVTGVCKAGGCVQVAAIGCDDGNPCTADACDTVSGKCVYKAGAAGVKCDDGNVCTDQDACGAAGCKGQPVACNDGNACTVDACDPTTEKGCVHKANEGLDCSDGDLCTAADVCKAGTCAAGPTLACDDGNPCTDDTCDASKGCAHTANASPCDDNNGCTVGDKCGVGIGGAILCTPGAAAKCDDGKLCTSDVCDPKAKEGKGGCVFKPDDGLGCDDGDVCTEGDQCKAGVCASGPPQLCNDDNVCTKDLCDPKKGCLTAPVAGKCDDNDVCTVGDTCGNGKCVPGKMTVCDDGVACTADSCDTVKGCQFVAITGKCNDGDACTEGDVCKGGVCAGPTPKVCNDGNACTDDSCDKVKGCVLAANTKACDDNDVCSIDDTCAGGTCKAGLKTKVCEDGKVCTANECDPVKGCQFPANKAECSDGNACTNNDQCDNFQCIPGPKLACDDHNLCTDDSCNAQTGCIHAKNSHPPFKAMADSAETDSGLWAITASNNKPKWSHVTGYWQMFGGLYATQYMTLKGIVDLSCATAPTLYFERRSYGADLWVEVSYDGAVWTPLMTWPATTDYVWRRRAVDLSGYVGKKVYLRLRTAPTNSNYWLHLRGFEIKEAEPLPKLIAWGDKISCADMHFEGPAFKCAQDGTGYQLLAQGVKSSPDSNKYMNYAYFDVRLDHAKVANPMLAIEERHAYGSLEVVVRPEGATSWQNVWTRPGGATVDPVWRKHKIDFSAVPGQKWQIAIGTNNTNENFWADLRNITFGSKPADPGAIKVPYKWQGCKGLELEGEVWSCDPAPKEYDLKYTVGAVGTKATYNYWHYVFATQRVDLTGTKKPLARYWERYYRGYLYLQVSTDGVVWSSLVGHTYGEVDYVWRETIADLSGYKGKEIWLRLAARPVYDSSVWGEVKGFEVAEAPEPWPVVSWGAQSFNCGHWSFDGPSWSCDAKAGFKLVGVDTTPSPNGYWQALSYQRTFDLSGAKDPVVRFELQRHYGELLFEARNPGGGWIPLRQWGNQIDEVWRFIEVDMAAFVGQKLELRLRGKPNYPATQPQWLHVRNFTLGSKTALPTVKFGSKLTCDLWRLEGPAFTCDPKEAQWAWQLEDKSATYNHDHFAELQAWLDLGTAVDPQLYFGQRSYGGPYFWVQLSEDGSKWSSVNEVYDTGTSSFFASTRYDLSDFAGKKVRVRMWGRPRSPGYHAAFEKLSWRERDKVVVVKPPQKVAADKLAPQGGWTWDAKTATWTDDHTYKSAWQPLTFAQALDLSGAKTPELRFESMGYNGLQQVDVSVDGVQWTPAWARNLNGLVMAGFEPVAVGLTPWAGQKQVWLRFMHQPNGAASGFWSIRGIEVDEHVSLPVAKAPLDLTPTNMRVIGGWKFDDKTGQYALNNPKDDSIAATVAAEHYLWPKVRLDISALDTPELTFADLIYYATPRVDVSVDQGVSWQGLAVTGVTSSVVWKYQAVDLGAYKGHKSLLVRISGRPGNAAYWWQVRDLRIDNRYVFPSIKAGVVPGVAQWKLETGMVADAKTGVIQRKDEALGQYVYAFLQQTYDLTGVKSPMLRLEETGNSGIARYFEVSDDGIIWQTVAAPSTNVSGPWTAVALNLSAMAGSPTVYVRVRVHISSKTYVWQMRKLHVSDK